MTIVFLVFVLAGAALASSHRRCRRRLATPLVIVGLIVLMSACSPALPMTPATGGASVVTHGG
jgi:hypothetical protein